MKMPYPPIRKAIDICRRSIILLQSLDQKDEAVRDQLEHEYIVCEALERHIPRPPVECSFSGLYLGCPTCCEPIDLNNIRYSTQHCQFCGQVIDFGGFKNEQ